jgi:copper chaperone CopZ
MFLTERRSRVVVSRLRQKAEMLTSEGRRPKRADLLKAKRPKGATMPDVTLVVNDVTGAEESEKLERALARLEFVDLVNVDSERGLVAVSYEGGEEELGKIEDAIEEAGHNAEPSPGADPDVD